MEGKFPRNKPYASNIGTFIFACGLSASQKCVTYSDNEWCKVGVPRIAIKFNDTHTDSYSDVH